jgi:hypothetical protein
MHVMGTGGGYLGEAITVAIVTFLALLAAFAAVLVVMAWRYHHTKHTFVAEASHRQAARQTVAQRS